MGEKALGDFYACRNDNMIREREKGSERERDR